MRLLVALLLLTVAPAHAQLDTLSHDGIVRDYHVHVPPSYDGSERVPVVIAFHGGFGSASNIEEQSGLSVVADDEGFLAVYPNGTGTIPTWNGGECCGYAARENIDDVGFVDRLIDRLAETYSIDQARIYATGISNGGAMTYRLACDLWGRIAAFAPVAATYRNEDCNPQAPVPIIHFHSERDDNVPMEGGVGNGPSNVEWLPLDSTLTHFAGYNGCTTRTEHQLSDSLRVSSWTGCTYQDEMAKAFVVSDGGHSWPGGTRTAIGDSVSTAADASREMWHFFQRFDGNVVEAVDGVRPIIDAISVSYYPNPASTTLRAEIELTGSEEMPIAGFPGGLYSAIVRGGTTSTARTVVVVR